MAVKTPQKSLAEVNAMQRSLILATAVNRFQQIYATTITTGAGSVINFNLAQVGLVKRIIIKIEATATSASGTHTLTTYGLSNFFSVVTFTDTSNVQRINCPSWYLTTIASAKGRQPFAAAHTAASNDNPWGYGSAYTAENTAPASITTSVVSNLFGYFEIPLAYSDADLRGAVWMGVTNATASVSLTINPNFGVATGTDATFAVYQSSTAVLATLSSVTITAYQEYLDQLPATEQGIVLPIGDLSVNYMLQTSPSAGLVVNQDYPIAYPNFRDIYSTTVVYNNAGVLNIGTDINYFALSTANVVNLFKVTPKEVVLWNRQRMRTDFPKAMYYFDHRARPINTQQYGNMALNINFSTVTSASSVVVTGYEMMAVVNNVTQAGSLST